MLTEEETRRFDALYREHAATIFRVCVAIGAGDRSWALDRAQDTFVKLATHLQEIGEVENMGGWLYKVAVNECRMNLRRSGTWRRVRTALRMAPAPSDAPTPERWAQSGQNARTFEQATARMQPTLRTIMTLIYIEQRTQTEVCQIVELSKAQVSKLHQRGLQILRTHDWEMDL